MTTEEMTKKIRELKELRVMADELLSEAKAIEDEIKAEMAAHDLDYMLVDIYKVRWTTVSTVRFDSTGFKKAMPDLYSKFTKQTESRRFSIA